MSNYNFIKRIKSIDILKIGGIMGNKKKAIQFIILTCSLSWAIAGIAIIFGLREEKGLLSTVFNALYMFLPAICTIILQLVYKEKPFRNVFISFRFNRWFVVAVIAPIILMGLTLGINLLFPNVSLTTEFEYIRLILPSEQIEQTIQQLSLFPLVTSIFIQIGQALIIGFTISTLLAFGEELGWSGYLLKVLQDMTFFKLSLLIGIIWGIWHFPLILMGHNYPQHPVAGVVMMILICILLTLMMNYIVIKSKSVIAAAIFHGITNAFGGITIFYLAGGNDLINGLTGLAGIFALLLVNTLFYLFDKYITKENIFVKKVKEYLK